MQVVVVKQYASFVFAAPEFIGLLLDLNVTKTGFRHLFEFMTRQGIDYTTATSHTFPAPIPTQQAFSDTWKDFARPLELRPPVTLYDPPASGRSWRVHSRARYVQSDPPLVDTIDWGRPLTFIVRGDAYPCQVANCPPGSSTSQACGPLLVGHCDCRVWQQRHGPFGQHLGREPSFTRRFCIALNSGLFRFKLPRLKTKICLKFHLNQILSHNLNKKV